MRERVDSAAPTDRAADTDSVRPFYMALAILGVFVVHLLPGLDTGGPMVFEDEIGYLMNGRAHRRPG